MGPFYSIGQTIPCVMETFSDPNQSSVEKFSFVIKLYYLRKVF